MVAYDVEVQFGNSLHSVVASISGKQQQQQFLPTFHTTFLCPVNHDGYIWATGLVDRLESRFGLVVRR